VVKKKNVLLFFSGLEFSGISKYVEILKTISKEMKDEYKIMLIPIVSRGPVSRNRSLIFSA